MKKNKGFTLIELLAIIVILALIAVIISPIILGIIEDSKLSAATDSAYGYKEAIGKYYASQLSQNSDFMLNGEYTIGSNGSISDEENTYDIAVSGTVPNSGYLTIEKGAVTAGCIQINEFAVTIEDRKVTNTEKGNCVNTPIEIVVEEFPQVTDENPGIICGNGDTEDYDNSTVCYIYSVEDLVAFSNMVNSGKNFSGKTVQLMNNLDIENDKSYLNPNTNQFGDVNENSTTSATLKEELTDETAKGFKPIGDNTNKFTGTFEGNAKTIKKLFINRSSENYVGLFGYNSGTIKGLKVVAAEIKGYQYVGLIAGYNYGIITGLIADGNVLGSSYIGLVAGDSYADSSNSYRTKIEAIVSGNIVSTATSNAYVGGITGRQYNSTTNGIYKSGSITTSTSTYVYRTIGYWSGGSGTTGALSAITQNENPVTSSNINSTNGYDIPANAINNIAMVDAIVDTYLGGDNNNDGYYYDYDTNGEFTVYKLSENPLEITMDGEGTEAEPYIINNYNDLKQVGYKLGTAGNGIYYSLNADIDLTNKNPIMLGSVYYANYFTGVFEGNAHTISNLNLRGYNYVGLSGYNSGTIRGLKVKNINATGSQYVGLIAGYNYGIITGLIADGNVSGSSYIGLVAGDSYADSSNSYRTKIEAIVSGNIVSTATSNAYVGGITGRQYNSRTTGIYKSGSITTATSTNVYRTIGYWSGGTGSTGALDTITVNENTVTSSNANSVSGKSYTAAELQTITPYQEVGLNTSPTTGEYRYALDSNYNPYIIKN